MLLTALHNLGFDYDSKLKLTVSKLLFCLSVVKLDILLTVTTIMALM